MKYVKDEDSEYMDTGARDLDGDPIVVRNADGYGGCDIQIEGSIMTWAQLDKLKAAIAIAENRWRRAT